MADRERDHIVTQGENLLRLVHRIELARLEICGIRIGPVATHLPMIQFELAGCATIALDSANVFGVDQRADGGRGARVGDFVERSGWQDSR